MQSLQLIPAQSSQAQAIREMAVRIWHHYYPDIISREQIDYMLEKMYSIESLRSQMQSGHSFYLIRKADKNVGFVSVNPVSSGEWFLNKLYIDPEEAGHGVGTEVLKQLEVLTRARTMRLTVNRQNYKAINFYFKNGFRIESVKDFDIGGGYQMNDFVMVKELAGG